MKAIILKCPNCGATHDPVNRNCNYCGSYIIVSNKDEEDYNPENFMPSPSKNGQEPKEVYAQGVLMQVDELPIRNCIVGQFKNMFYNIAERMLLTNKRLIFNRNSKVIIQNDETTLELSLSDIESVNRTSGILFKNTYFNVVTKNNETFCFNAATHKRQQKWIECITAAIQGGCCI